MEVGLQNELIEFMFKRDVEGNLDVMKCLHLWFGKSNATDIEIESRFGGHVANALNGGLNEWKKTPRGCLALMILVDQFPRNIYRHTIHSFSGDSLARKIVDAGHDWLEVLMPEECLFVPCLIMTHQENLTDQQLGLQFYDALESRLPSELRIFRTILEEHHRIISLCGSFPHRDHYYRRPTSHVGRVLMENPKLRFDLPLITKNGAVKFGHDPKRLWQTTQLAFDVLERIDALADGTARRRSSMPAGWLSPNEAAECYEIFRAFDKDGSGFLDRDELATIFAATGRSHDEGQLQRALNLITGREGSASITFEQFAALSRVKMTIDKEAAIRKRFEHFDLDGSGEISLEELKKGIQGLDSLVTCGEIEEMLKECDIDGNGAVSYDEFLVMVSRLPRETPIATLTFTTPSQSTDILV